MELVESGVVLGAVETPSVLVIEVLISDELDELLSKAELEIDDAGTALDVELIDVIKGMEDVEMDEGLEGSTDVELVV